MTQLNNIIITVRILVVGAAVLVTLLATSAYAASISVTPATGVHQSGSTFTVRVAVNTAGQPINAADATLSFNPRELAVVSANRTGSIFNLWVTEPTFSNAAGTINFSGGLPAGYTGSAGTVMNVTFRVLGSGTARVNFSSGSVLANDGRGTNVLTTMNGGSYTLQAASAAAVPEEIEYVAPPNTPAAPSITSTTHADATLWHKVKSASLSWNLPVGVTQVRTLLDQNPTSVPTRVYESPISSITLDDLPEGVSYFHLQFRNAEGWGRVSRYRLAVDSVAPSGFTITQSEDNDATSPTQTLLLTVNDATSEVNRYKVKIDNDEPYDYLDETASGTIALPPLLPGYHTVIIEAFDQAGNSIIATYSFTIAAFERPVFTEYPSEINEEVIPVIRGLTRPHADVVVRLQKLGAETSEYTLRSDDEGIFTFIPASTLSSGVYELSAIATDQYGAMSDPSDTVRIAVQQPGFVRVGTLLISIASIIVPLIALIILSIICLLFLGRYLRRFRRTVGKESAEALTILQREFTSLQTTLREQESALQASRKNGKLTMAEAEMIEIFDRALQSSQRAVEKEIKDVTKLTN